MHLGSLYMNVVTRGTLKNNRNNSTAQKGTSFDTYNSKFAKVLVSIMIFMRKNRSTLLGNNKAASAMCQYLSNFCATLQTNSVTRVTPIESTRNSYIKT